MPTLHHFHSIRPPYETGQEATFDWFADAHAEAHRTQGGQDVEAFRQTISEKFRKVGAKPECIEKRGHTLPDFLHRDWSQMEVYRLSEQPGGLGLSQRMKHFEAAVDGIFDSYYPEGSRPPDDLIHVSCTGYLSPSGAQKLVSKKRWGAETTVTHAYHMGCYGAFPAIRMGAGFLACGKQTIDIVHTEVCSIHSNPSMHETDQLVSQSLFADGFMKYTVSNDADCPHYQIIALREEIVPDSIESMTWNLADWGNRIFLAKEIPVLIARSLEGYLSRLAQKGRLSETFWKKALFAIHPGGPKIIRQIQDRLALADSQVAHSLAILKDYGNMSSATLPHVWEAALADSAVQANTPIVSLAFGPGLSISGSIMVKACGS